MSEVRPACAHCVYWKAEHTSNTPTAGHCHRFPPGIHTAPSGTVIQKFPMTDRSQWCGEWSDDDSALVAGARRALVKHA